MARGVSLDGGELISILRHTAKVITDLRVQDLHHEGLGTHFPYTGQPMAGRRLKPETRVERRMADDHDERAAHGAKPFNAGLHEAAADALSLMTWGDSHWGESCALNGSDEQRAEHDVPDDYIGVDGHQREHSRAIGSQRIDDPAFLVLREGEPIDFSNRGNIARPFVADLDHVVSELSGERPAAQPRAAGDRVDWVAKVAAAAAA